MILESPDFNDGDTIPVRFTCDGEDVSPAFEWSGVPDDAVELLFVCSDPDAPRGTFQHWAVFGISPNVTSLPGGIGPRDTAFGQAVNDTGGRGWTGPCPPRGDDPHGYHFRLVALDRSLKNEIGEDDDVSAVLERARGHEIESVELVAYYGRT